MNLLKLQLLAVSLFAFLPIADARFGWNFSEYTLFAGQGYSVVNTPAFEVEFQYDYLRKGCTYSRKYTGIGINYSKSSERLEIGLKAMFSPLKTFFPITSYSTLYPYTLLQLNTSKPNWNTSNQTNYNIRPGIGVLFNTFENKQWNIRSYAQIGYNTLISGSEENHFILQLKIGIGFNSYYKRKVRKDEE